MDEARPELPELPRKDALGYSYSGWREGREVFGHSDEAMRRYACAAVLAERERCAKLAESNKWTGYVPPEDGSARDYYDNAGQDIAAAIRQGA